MQTSGPLDDDEFPRRMFSPDDPSPFEYDDAEFPRDREADIQREIEAQQEERDAWLYMERKADAFDSLRDDERIGRLA
jgi:hypothetical protein